MTETTPTVTKSIYATVGAGDALYAAVTEVFEKMRERATTTDLSGRVEEARERLAGLPADVRHRLSTLPSELPDDLADLRERLNPGGDLREKFSTEVADKFTTEEVRKLADQYYHQFLDLYSDLASRGEQTVDRLRTTPGMEGRIEKVEGVYNDVLTRAEGVFDRVNSLLGTKPAESTPASEPVVDAEVIEVTTETEPVADASAEPAPAKKAAPRKAAPKKPAAPTES